MIDSIFFLFLVIFVIINVVWLNILKSEKVWEFYGNIGVYGMMIVYFNNDDVIELLWVFLILWKYNGKVWFKEVYLDIIYILFENKLFFYLIFNIGKYYYLVEERY